MSLRTKTLTIIGATLVALIVLLFIISQTVLLSSFEQLETQGMRRNVQRVLNTISEDEYEPFRILIRKRF